MTLCISENIKRLKIDYKALFYRTCCFYTNIFLSVEPNAGLPQLVSGKTVFPDSPEEMFKNPKNPRTKEFLFKLNELYGE